MKPWQELAKEHDAALKAIEEKRAELQAALIAVLQEKYPDFKIEEDYDIHVQDTSSIFADGKEFNVGNYRYNDPELFETLLDYPEIEELLYLLAT